MFGLLIRPASVAASPSVKVAGRFTEVPLGRRFHPVQTTAEVNAVEVILHDLILRQRRLDAAGDVNFQDFAAEGPALEREGIAGELLRDRAGSLADMRLANAGS